MLNHLFEMLFLSVSRTMHCLCLTLGIISNNFLLLAVILFCAPDSLLRLWRYINLYYLLTYNRLRLKDKSSELTCDRSKLTL